MKFKAAMFDFDGTVTPDGVYKPSHEMVDALVRLANIMPIAFCTGRQLGSFEKRAMTEFLKEVPEERQPGFFRNLHLVAENGSLGYYFDVDKGGFVEFYREKWPEELIERDELMTRLNEAVSEFGEICYGAHKVVVVMRTHMTNLPEEERTIEKVNEMSREIYKIVIKFLKELNEDYEKFVHVGDSGIGVVIVPAYADKDNGIRRFGEYLNRKRGIEFSDNFKEILVVGDRPLDGGNDHYFLSGRFGTPYTVGDFDKNKESPVPVRDDDGNKLLHDKGTLHLIKSLL